MKFEDQHLDLLQNIEFGIIQVYLEDKTITDFNVFNVLESLIDASRRKYNHQETVNYDLKENEGQIFDTIIEIVNSRTNNREDVKLNIAAFRKILKSAKKWNKRRGKRGYLTFVENYIA